ncbi:alpha-N-arabinofuranosidase A [Aspergillus homomorphus CBS 101889]|uniref:non-reducing end alpha-L-arabinofuranosidase n=1 Tax=Aspergillus homomorphus (strain CBS 101889) TaxID=1450537 RepID=A0A395HNL3_ASPHC|nr:alpha-N-arabinofuranosidase A [Aspergillus homomorphus CBS 101889]RAL08865.1 alpha-N-arabinofuranosidase A [Aspergillus homomorphus CBS 101889]
MKACARSILAAAAAWLPQEDTALKPSLAPRASATPGNSSAVNLTVVTSGGNQSSPLLYGIMFEEMDHSGDGGLHGQLLQNNGFQGANPGLTAYKPIGQAEIMQDYLYPVSGAITSSLQVSVENGATGRVGFANTGYKGIPVINSTYWCEFWMLGDYSGEIILQLAGSSNGNIFASHNITVASSQKNFTRYTTQFNSTAAPDGNNEWRLLFNASKVSGGTLNFGLPQLFPPTYKSRPNGLRDDIAQAIADMRPTFLRFPGGNNLEGLEVDSRWQWNLTIGPVVERPGRQSDWFYPNTDALGLDEYLWWCEDMGMAPVLAVWDGKSYGDILSGNELEPYIQDILHELEYLLGAPNTTYGSLRAKNGRLKPWPVQYVEIGNEDDFTGGCATYPQRFMQIYNAVHKNYPNITLITSVSDPKCLPSNPPPGIIYDFHYYRSADQLVAMFHEWDHQSRSRPVMIGEYGCRNTSDPDGFYWTYMQCSCGEAVHMIGLERNSDVIKMASYAPLLQNFPYTQWWVCTPTLIGFDSSPGSLTLSTSYYVQKMFSTYQGQIILPVNSTSSFGPLYWVASRSNSTYFVKMANYGNDNRTVRVTVPKTTGGLLEMLSGPRDGVNRPRNSTIQPVTQNITAIRDSYTIQMPAWSVAVLVVR